MSPNGMGMESDHISRIKDWPTPETVQDFQVLLGFMNFYQRYIKKYAKVTTRISDRLKKAETSRMPKQLKWELTWNAEPTFRKLERAFSDTPILNLFDLGNPIILQTDASGVALASNLNPHDAFSILRPANFYSQKYTGAKQN